MDLGDMASHTRDRIRQVASGTGEYKLELARYMRCAVRPVVRSRESGCRDKSLRRRERKGSELVP